MSISAVSLALLCVTLALLDPGIRTEMVRIARGEPSAPVVDAVAHFRERAAYAARSLWDQGLEHPALTLFIVAAGVVFLCMLKLQPDR
jgi:hypothetical protein